MIFSDIVNVESLDVSRIDLEADAIRRVPRALALRHEVLPLYSRDNELTVAIAEPEDRDAIDRIRLVTGMRVRAVLAPRDVIRMRLLQAYPEPPAHAIGADVNRAQEAPAIRALDEMHALAVRSGASDIHVEPFHAGGRVRFRVDGILWQATELPADLHGQVTSRIKLLAGMDIADRRTPQDGRYTIEQLERSIDARVSSIPTLVGEKLAIRLLDHQARVPSLEDLGMCDESLRRFRRIVHAPHGFVVVSGPTGSGKTTTLYAAMSERNVDSQNLCSVEDPVEVRIPGVCQVQTNSRAGVTFAVALRAFLRQDPNVIMVGEMRDEETAAVAASAALSGQLVVTTLHANDAPTTVDRLVELGVSRHTIAAGLTAVVAQRLVRRLCGQCRVPLHLSDANAREFGLREGAQVYRAQGCTRCRGTGYNGRTAIFECLFLDDPTRVLINEGVAAATLAERAVSHGYEPMLAAALRCAVSGETSLEEIRRVLYVEGAA